MKESCCGKKPGFGTGALSESVLCSHSWCQTPIFIRVTDKWCHVVHSHLLSLRVNTGLGLELVLGDTEAAVGSSAWVGSRDFPLHWGLPWVRKWCRDFSTGGNKIFLKWPILNRNEREKVQTLWASSCAALQVVCLSLPQFPSEEGRLPPLHSKHHQPVPDLSWNQHSLRELSFPHEAGSLKHLCLWSPGAVHHSVPKGCWFHFLQWKPLKAEKSQLCNGEIIKVSPRRRN